jgi:hypothetical protein
VVNWRFWGGIVVGFIAARFIGNLILGPFETKLIVDDANKVIRQYPPNVIMRAEQQAMLSPMDIMQLRMAGLIV